MSNLLAGPANQPIKILLTPRLKEEARRHARAKEISIGQWVRLLLADAITLETNRNRPGVAEDGERLAANG